MLRGLDEKSEEHLKGLMGEMEEGIPDRLSAYRKAYRRWLRGRKRREGRLESWIGRQNR